MAFTYEL